MLFWANRQWYLKFWKSLNNSFRAAHESWKDDSCTDIECEHSARSSYGGNWQTVFSVKQSAHWKLKLQERERSLIVKCAPWRLIRLRFLTLIGRNKSTESGRVSHVFGYHLTVQEFTQDVIMLLLSCVNCGGEKINCAWSRTAVRYLQGGPKVVTQMFRLIVALSFTQWI